MHTNLPMTMNISIMEDGKYKAIEDKDWYQKVKALFDDSDDEKVFVGVDCHI